MFSLSRPFASSFSIVILNIYIVLAVFSVIGAVTAAPQSSKSNPIISGTNESKDKGYYTKNVVKANITHSHTFKQTFAPNGSLAGVTGKYEVLLTDGRTQTVTYVADGKGYRTVSVNYVNSKSENSVRALDNVESPDNVKAPNNVKAPDNIKAPDNVKAPSNIKAPDNVKAPSAPVSARPSAARSPDCNALPSPGECRGAFPRVFFNSTSSQCDCFLWGGCDDEDTKSSWLTLDDCSATCIPDNTKPGPRCRIATEPETQTFAAPPLPKVPVAEAPDTTHINDAVSQLNDADFLESLGR